MTIVDVGVRNGPLPMFLKLPNVHIIGFEPDEQECARLSEQFPTHEFRPYALGSAPHYARFFLTKDPQCSSFYLPIESADFPQHDLVGEKILAVTTLDGFGLRPEVLKLDTQGSELDILKGAEETLESVQVVITEVEFRPLYEHQPLFAEVNGFLIGKGFDFHGLKDDHYFHGEPYWADAWYFRPGAEPIIEMLEAA